MHHSTPLITTIVGALVLAFLLGMVANRLRVSPLVGYLLAGVFAGPYTPGFVADTKLALELAELGVILLMFGVGLHFSLQDLMEVKSIAIPGAVAQMTAATLMGLLLARLLNWSAISGFVFGLCLSTASTVVLLRALEERRLHDTERGRIATGWLIVEDLIMVLILVLLPAIASMVEQGNTSMQLLIWDLIVTISKVAAFMLLTMIVGRRAVPWILARSAATGSRELFTLSVLALALGIAFGAVEFFGVSFALGAFFAGMTLNESSLSHRAAHDTLPLRDAFAVLFFVSVGMLFNPAILYNHPFSVLGALTIIIVGKSAIAWLLVIALGRSKRTALTIAASLAQIGEFSFILSSLGITLQLLNEDGQNLILASSILSIMLNPVLFSLLERHLIRNETVEEQTEIEAQEEERQIPLDVHNHALLVGCGGVGNMLLESLLEADVPLVVVENVNCKVKALRQRGINTVLGNAANEKTMTLARLDRARWLIIAISNSYEAGEIALTARAMQNDIKIIARAKHHDEMNYIRERGATQVIMDEHEVAKTILGVFKAELDLER